MAYFTARQRESDRRWDYTCQNSAGTYPIGYCSGPELAHFSAEEHRSKYHDDGHATAEEAYACHRAYELDNSVRYHDRDDTQKKCLICEAWTTRRAVVGQELTKEYALCEAHANRESLEKVHRVE